MANMVKPWSTNNVIMLEKKISNQWAVFFRWLKKMFKKKNNVFSEFLIGGLCWWINRINDDLNTKVKMLWLLSLLNCPKPSSMKLNPWDQNLYEETFLIFIEISIGSSYSVWEIHRMPMPSSILLNDNRNGMLAYNYDEIVFHDETFVPLLQLRSLRLWPCPFRVLHDDNERDCSLLLLLEIQVDANDC